MGPRPACEGETGPIRHPDRRDRGVDAAVRIARDQRRLGRCVADVVASGPVRTRVRQTPGDLPGQRAEELGAADAVLEADGGVRRLVGAGDPVGTRNEITFRTRPPLSIMSGWTTIEPWNRSSLRFCRASTRGSDGSSPPLRPVPWATAA